MIEWMVSDINNGNHGHEKLFGNSYFRWEGWHKENEDASDFDFSHYQVILFLRCMLCGQFVCRSWMGTTYTLWKKSTHFKKQHPEEYAFLKLQGNSEFGDYIFYEEVAGDLKRDFEIFENNGGVAIDAVEKIEMPKEERRPMNAKGQQRIFGYLQKD